MGHLIVYDHDGVLVNPWSRNFEFLKDQCKRHKKKMAFTTQQQYERTLSAEGITYLYTACGFERSDMQRIWNAWLQYHTSAPVHVFKDMHALLNDPNTAHAIVSGNADTILHYQLKQFNLDRDTVDGFNGHTPEQLPVYAGFSNGAFIRKEEAFDLLMESGDTMAYVTDAVKDCDCVRAYNKDKGTNIILVGVGWGLDDPMDMWGHGADYIAKDIHELTNAVNDLR
ncbi:MAG: hypothetical protein QF486_02860 [Candidatus Woesearchaeota archaeon]|jgi:phosphoglycolate phosphatase-like HAD superfamily hydrolase|nr:hypothetical protein [Candidatus Woesearchaeota archaeon]MDP7181495.1 hypothetical protein [Candidatus Woesearchaeota archaeon]MDP7198537.1 hypothetical protein [Candidatus Woesearchaeota archaeon]MDP7466721.1 hypothetical protein [Candidatus Woesearchaeota archaeon]MDP7647176.1 hypothetical protein [Candidatus Woesearchaeota archaeon]|tara:strand:- start:218 stop:895 length:678 start_codon:yes stop_codon:yes gene_type:complete